MRLGPILQVIVAVPELAPALSWAASALGLSVGVCGRFPREVALTIGSTALVEARCQALGMAGAPALLLLVEAPPEVSALTEARGWIGLGLRGPGTAGSVAGLGLLWTRSAGAVGIDTVSLSVSDRAHARGYYRGLGAGSPERLAPWTLPLGDGVLHLLPADSPQGGFADPLAPPGRPIALVMSRSSAVASLSAPAAHSHGADGDILLLRDSTVLPERS